MADDDETLVSLCRWSRFLSMRITSVLSHGRVSLMHMTLEGTQVEMADMNGEFYMAQAASTKGLSNDPLGKERVIISLACSQLAELYNQILRRMLAFHRSKHAIR